MQIDYVTELSFFGPSFSHVNVQRKEGGVPGLVEITAASRHHVI